MLALGLSFLSVGGVSQAQTKVSGQEVAGKGASVAGKSIIDDLISKNENLLSFMKLAIEQRDEKYEDLEIVKNKWIETKSIVRAMDKDKGKYKSEYVEIFKEQENLFSEYLKYIYVDLTNRAAESQGLKFRFDFNGNDLLILVPEISQVVKKEYQNSQFLNPNSQSYKDIVSYGFKSIGLIDKDGKKEILSLIK